MRKTGEAFALTEHALTCTPQPWWMLAGTAKRVASWSSQRLPTIFIFRALLAVPNFYLLRCTPSLVLTRTIATTSSSSSTTKNTRNRLRTAMHKGAAPVPVRDKTPYIDKRDVSGAAWGHYCEFLASFKLMVVAPSRTQGTGLFLCETAHSGEVVLEYGGERLSVAAREACDVASSRQGTINDYMLTVGDRKIH